MRRLKLWMMVAFMTPAAMLTSCLDNIDNSVSPTYPGGESQAQAKFWEKFNQWQTDSCSVGDDFFMHMTGKFWWNPTTIYPEGLMPYAASEMFEKTVTLTDDTGDPDLKTIQEVVNASTPEKEPTEAEMNEMVDARLNEIWQGATTMEQAMEAFGRATALGYNNCLEPVVKIVDGKPAFALDTPMPRYYAASSLGPLYDKAQLQERQAYRGGRATRSAAAQIDANKAAFIKGMNLGVAAEEVVWENTANENYAELMKAMLTPDSIKKFVQFADQLVDNYNKLLMMPWASKTLYCNGKGTLAENIADIGGCCLGLDLLLARHPDASAAQIKQLTKRYFQAWAIVWSRSYDLDFAEDAYYNDEHSQSRERVNGVLRNINA